MTAERCEWNPARDVPAMDPPSPGDCTNTTAYSVGVKPKDNFHLCADCAARPKWRRFKKRPLKPDRIDAHKANGLGDALRRWAAQNRTTFDPRPPWEREHE